MLDQLTRKWNEAGVKGGIPTDQKIVKRIKPGDDIQAAIKEVNKKGGGVLLLEEGTYKITQTINMEDNVVVRGVDRKAVILESSIEARYGDGPIFYFKGDSNSGIENLTMTYDYDGRPSPDPHNYSNDPYGTGMIRSSHVRIETDSNNNWIRDTDMIDAGWRVVNVKGNNNTLTGNYVDGTHQKGGGGGYYLITGDNNLI